MSNGEVETISNLFSAINIHHGNLIENIFCSAFIVMSIHKYIYDKYRFTPHISHGVYGHIVHF